jgi:hypothetical protein
MQKFIKKILLFVTLLSISYMVTMFIIVNTKLLYLTPNISITTGGYSHNLERFREVSKLDPEAIDVLLLGSSHCYRGFDPRILNTKFTSFNLGNSAQTPYTSYHLAEQYIQIIKPKKIILEAYWGSLMAPSSSIESSIDVISNKHINSADVFMILSQKNVTAINSLFGNMVFRINHSLDSETQDTFKGDKYISGGYVQRLSKKNKHIANKEDTGEEIKYNPYQISYLIKLMTLCKVNNIELEVVRAPVTSIAINKITNFHSITQELDSICEVNAVKFTDYCSKSAIDDMNLIDSVDFYDLHHLSQTGVTKFNNYYLEND